MTPPVPILPVLRVGAAAAFAVLCLVAVPPLEAQSEQIYPGDPVAGRRLFVERRCVRCHAIWGNGGTLGPDFAMVGAGRSLPQLAGMFWNHTPQMIETVRDRGFEWPRFTETELADLISYIYYVKLFDEPGDPTLGERSFRDKRCADCHAVGGSGGTSGPALDGYARFVAPIALAQGMWNAGPSMQALLRARGFGPMEFLGREIADIQAYIRSASRVSDREIVFLQPPDPDNGRRLFVQRQCARCHGPQGRGTTAGPNLRAATERLRVAQIAGQLWNHSSQMASAMQAGGMTFPRFRGTELADLIAFLYYLRFYETAGDLKVGEQLFSTKGCAACHPTGAESVTGPDLSQSEVLRTPLGLATAMWDHAPAMYAQIQSADVEWPRFEGDEMRDLSVYLRTLASRGREGTTGR